ncbi:hypothetical protein, partial [Thiolapillus sp.]|uniref:hypothetical protein n=2 Tax=Thiolapillus sp. TaxID=2017437 RepID=UPI003AF9B530
MPQPSWSPSTTQQLRKLVAAPYLAPNDWTPRSEAYFVFPLAQGTPGKQCGLAATGVYQPSLRSPWLAADEGELAQQVRTTQPMAALVIREIRASEKIDYPNFVIGLIVTNHDSRSGFLSNRFSNSRMACLL